MEVTALCMQIFMNMFVLLLTKPDLSYTDQKPVFPLISPDRLQFFEYESVSVSCEEDKEVKAWRVRRKLHKMSSANDSDACSVPAASCSIQYAFERHSGEYWCENHEGEKSRALNISVTAGSVILNISARPVKEGSDVTLRCFNKNTNKTHISDFYKDGVHLSTNYKTGMTLGNVSKSDEGLYKCTISRAGESPESWLAVTSAEE
ncbi:PREDICTED: Fc receptor-like protein 5, partial [Poecilia mexicana]|uniref:Fc receptor-like protein 5 n=1 Tax=Poecilia mexicana TaxID=48701 RepID=UPI00072EC8F1